MGRGLERRHIFAGTDDKQDFLARLGDGLAKTQCQCLAWAIMSNHYHLLIRVSSEPLSKLMGKLLSGYATQYNRRKKRSGYVFQNRYKSILCDEDAYLLELIRYIHLNPLKAKIVRSLPELERYPWSGHAGLMGKHEQDWHAKEEVLGLFAHHLKRARTHYRHFIQEGINDIASKDYLGGGLVRSYGGWESVKLLRKEHEIRIGDERILGGSRFVEAILDEDRLNINEKSRWQQKGWDLQRLVEKVCETVGIDQSDLALKGRQNAISTAKSLICYWGTQVLGISSTDISTFLCVSQPAVSKASKQGAKYCQQQGIGWEDVVKN